MSEGQLFDLNACPGPTPWFGCTPGVNSLIWIHSRGQLPDMDAVVIFQYLYFEGCPPSLLVPGAASPWVALSVRGSPSQIMWAVCNFLVKYTSTSLPFVFWTVQRVYHCKNMRQVSCRGTPALLCVFICILLSMFADILVNKQVRCAFT